MEAPLLVKLVFLGPLIPFGFWITWQGLMAADWRITSEWHVVACATRMLVGAGVTVAAMLMIVS